MEIFVAKKTEKLSEFLLKEYAGDLSYGAFCKLLRKKDIKINGKRTSRDCQINVGDEITCYYDKKFTCDYFYDEIFKNEDLIIIDKPQGIESDDVFNKVLKKYPTAIYTHRLDRNTSGLMIFCLKQTVYEEIYTALKERTISKFYLAHVYGKMPKQSDVMTAYLVKDHDGSCVKIYDREVVGSKKIKTGYKVLSSDEETSVVEVELFTGRTHQIRAHLAYVGNFIIGDGKYGNGVINKSFKAKYQRLTAYKIIFHFDENSLLGYLDGKVIESKIKFNF